jgi:precorrin-8X/cobalt-precorrin-8 methylmutase
MNEWNLPPQEIERRSMAIIDQEAGDHGWPSSQWPIVRRIIHSSADFSYKDMVRMHPKAVESGLQALKKGCTIFTDTRMAKAGMSAWRLEPLGVKVESMLALPQVAQRAQAEGTTRSVAAVDLVLEAAGDDIFAIGNAPTALLRLIEHLENGSARPSLVVGVPVGFVNAAESKEALLKLDQPYITSLGRKGGSAVAASIINALAQMATDAEL